MKVKLEWIGEPCERGFSGDTESCCLHVCANINLYIYICVETWIVRRWLGAWRLAGQRGLGSQGARCVAVSGEAASFLLREVSLGSKTFA